ncbi:HNH endonuclease family protein [uncultured Pseudoalteromonas sp.]|uniref:HNH endonuclease family protein n=1 Tax=uncultured Pseudoalteromonas sp. TaxID=114053 RepID=UPI002598441F|nr:HNH endonuclease family protein [uncultured Pseudoalteromonas sp.]
MKSYILKTLLFSCLLLYITTSFAETVKKSKSGICHDKHSSYYAKTKKFSSFSDLASCLKSGGRLPKNYKKISRTNNNVTTSLSAKNYQNTKYSRNEFGSGWADLNSDCQNSRMEALISQSVSPVRYKSHKKCKVKSGKWVSSFTGDIIFDASQIDIDHVVPLSWSWKHGANVWSKKARIKFANDPANLLSVEASLNRQKGDKGLDNWLPPKNKCQYISRFLRVLKTYNLELSDSESSQYIDIKRQYCRND